MKSEIFGGGVLIGGEPSGNIFGLLGDPGGRPRGFLSKGVGVSVTPFAILGLVFSAGVRPLPLIVGCFGPLACVVFGVRRALSSGVGFLRAAGVLRPVAAVRITAVSKNFCIGFVTVDGVIFFVGLLVELTTGAATPTGRYLLTSLCVAPRCIISLASLSKRVIQVGHFLLARSAANSLFNSSLKCGVT